MSKTPLRCAVYPGRHPAIIDRATFAAVDAKLKAKAGRRRPFFTTFKSGRKAMVRRKGKKRLPLQVLWHFPSKVQVEARFDFDDLVESHVRKHWPKNMTRALDDALRTAI